ncbi:MAG: VOC family protein, partial [Xanthobacteraceae bacterium]
GLSMLVLEGSDTAAEAEAFRTAGIGDFEPFHFERAAARPDGTSVKVAFSLAFARDPGAPDIGFFTCRQHQPENFWNPAFQQHPNTAATIAGVVLVADNPSAHDIFLSAFAGERDLLATSTGVTVTTPRGEIQVMTPAAFASHFGVAPPDTARGARLAALRFAVHDVGAASSLLYDAEPAIGRHMSQLVVGPATAMGATLVFEPA